jgi:hypothetical protein
VELVLDPPPAREDDEEEDEEDHKEAVHKEEEDADQEEAVHQEESKQEELEEEEGFGGDGFVLDPSLRWELPKEYVETDRLLPLPGAMAPYQLGISNLPELPYAYSGIIIEPHGRR